ncbi:hypothetical protein ACKWRH_05925 [Bradyrhizobium sp. Pa8]|uniref:hypothetical protein n=1 Tax=Bradyrhizobium sp. Pa8 TaxID=3386552 RepID=UPI00403F04E3
MAGAIETVVHTNSDSDSAQSAADRQKLEAAFGSVLCMAAMQSMDRNITNFREAAAEIEEDT